MRNTKKLIFKISIILGAAATIISTSAYAWFTGGRDSIATIDSLDGSVLQSYFHSGNGSENNPFTITTPWHYENFAKLHYTMEGFAEAGYHFEFGYPLRGGTTRYFYGTDENGVVDRSSYVTTLNLGGESFAPIGSEEKPFIGSLNGNNLTISNFVVDGNGKHDIGIFGFIGETSEGKGAEISNVYFSDFTVSTKGATKTDKHDDVGERIHSENAHVGYIAGHVVRATDINNVYVNNCTIDGKTTKDRTVDTYGYYGKVEYDHTNGQRQTGDNYSFDLHASEIYNAINSNYNSIRDNPLRTRVGKDDDDMGRHYADYDFPIAGESDWVNNRASHPFSEAVTRVNANTYRLNGVTTDTPTEQVASTRSYSLSTVGYQPLTGGIRNEYEVSSTDSRWSNPDGVTTNKNAPALANQSATGDFFRYDSSGQQWYYQHSENVKDKYTEAKKFTFNLSCSENITISRPGGGSSDPSMDFSSYTPKVIFYIDGEIVYEKGLDTSNMKLTNRDVQTGFLSYDHFYDFTGIKLSESSFTWSLTRGHHYYAAFIAFMTKQNVTKYCYLSDVNNTLSPISSADYRYMYVNQHDLIITDEIYVNGNLGKTFELTNFSHYNRTNTYSPSFTLDNKKWDGTIPQYVDPNSFEVALTGTKRPDGKPTPLKESSIESFSREIVTDIEYDDQGNPQEVSRKVWVASDNPTRSPDSSQDPIYLSDAQSLIDKNYKYKNIDIVGGNVTFYYLGTILFIPVNLEVITLPPETQNTNIVEMPSKTDIDGSKQFYATKYCPGSVVMYVNNSGNPLDNVDSQLGHIEFTYANMNIQGRTLVNVTRPAFKKGNGNFVNVETLGRVQEGEQFVNFVSTFEGDITESGARKTSYCCLDSQGKILGLYDANGNPGYGFFKAATDEPADERYSLSSPTEQNPYGTYVKDTSGSYVLNKDRVNNISTYVIVLGSSSRSSNNGTYITDISFSYKAHEGSGGSFGPVGYRDATDTITDTIFNFFFDAPADLNYSIKIYFNKNDNIYYITFSADGKITITIFNYEIDNYSIYFNGSLLADNDGNNLEVNVVNYDPGG